MPLRTPTLLSLALLAPLARAQDPAAGTSVERGAVEQELGQIEWIDGTLEEVLERARREDRLVFVEFWSRFCPYCKKLEKTTWRDATVIKELRDVLCVSLDGEAPENRELVRRLAPRRFPTLCFLEPDGALRDSLIGYWNERRFVEELRRIKKNEGTLSQLRARIELTPSDVDTRFELAKRLKVLGDLVGYRRQVEAIREHDPEGTSVPSRHFRLADLRRGAEASLRPEDLYAFLEEETEREILLEGWYAVWQLEQYLERTARKAEERAVHRERTFAAARLLWKQLEPESEHLVSLGSAIASGFHDGRAYLSPEDLRWALGVAEAVVRADPEDAAARDVLSRLYSVNGRPEDAKREARRAAELDPQNPRWRERWQELARQE